MNEDYGEMKSGRGVFGNKEFIRLAIYVLFGAIVAYLAYQLPYCHDDWHWGLPDRLKLMMNLFKNYNGRYLGNLTIILLTRSTIAKTLIPSFWMVWLLHEMERGVFSRRKAGCRLFSLKSGEIESRSDSFKVHADQIFLLIIAILLLAMLPEELFGQSYGWLSAFANFVPPVILFLCWFNLTEDVYTENCSQNILLFRNLSPAKMILIFLLGFCTQLFSENVTVFALIYAFWLIFYARLRTRKFCTPHIVYLAGVMSGAVLMFTNRGYRNEAGYKTVSISISGMYYQLRDQIMDHLFLNNVVLNVSLALVIVCLLARAEASSSSKSSEAGKKHSLLNAFIALIVCGFAFYSVWHSLHPDWHFCSDEGTNNLVELLLCALFFVFVLIGIWRTVDSPERIGICVLYFCAAASAAPLMAASPIGARCFYFNYALQCLTALKLAEYFLRGRKFSIWYPTLLTAAAVAVMGAAYSYAFTCNGATERYRLQLVEEAVESETEEVVLPYMPYPSCCYLSEPMNEGWMKYYKDFYGIPQDMTVTFQ